jgi:biopolymer transport protein ExbD
MSLPSAQLPPRQPDEPEPKINRIIIDRQGRTFLNDEPLIMPALRERLRQLKAADPDPAVVVKAADNLAYQNIVNVLDALRQSDITKVGLATEGVTLRP